MTTAHIGYTLSSEEHEPSTLVTHAGAAEAAGFDFVSISDHYHPWVDRQGHSPFVWSVIGGIAATTERIGLGTGVTCPTQRIHPAIIAQAAATTGVDAARMLRARRRDRREPQRARDRTALAGIRGARLPDAVEDGIEVRATGEGLLDLRLDHRRELLEVRRARQLLARLAADAGVGPDLMRQPDRGLLRSPPAHADLRIDRTRATGAPERLDGLGVQR